MYITECIPRCNTIRIFRTSVNSRVDVLALKPALDAAVGSAGKWTIDLEDCDRVLRMESHHLDPNEICRILKDAGYWCLEME